MKSGEVGQGEVQWSAIEHGGMKCSTVRHQIYVVSILYCSGIKSSIERYK